MSETQGTATYRVPLVIPPGPNGHTPKFALVYESRGAKGPAGPFGFGWRLKGLSAIERDRKFGPPYDLSQPLGSAFAYRNDFVLDGQDLIYDSSSAGRDRYRTQRDDGRLIEYIPSQNKWEVRDRQGRLLEYGETSDRRVTNDRTGETFSWLLQNAYDAHGNWIRYTYEIVQGVPYVTYVHWGTGASLTQMMGFLRTSRPDEPVTYSAGFRQKTDSRVNAIRTWSLVGGAFLRASQYSLSYDQDPASGRSRLVGVVRSASDNLGTIPPHSFTYTETEPGFSAAPSNYIAAAPAIEPGFMEQIQVYTLTSTSKQLTDLDGDAITDVYGFDGSAFQRWPGDGSEYLNTPETWSTTVYRTDVTIPGSLSVQTMIDTLDMDGDRIPDRVSSNLWPWRSTSALRQEWARPFHGSPMSRGLASSTPFQGTSERRAIS